MITTKGQIIDINGKTEWVLFHRLTKKVNPVDFLALTDSMIQFPNFLFTVSFFILIFLLQEPLYFLFYVGVVVTVIELMEEIILVALLPRWEANVKGLFWVLKREKHS